MTKKVREKLIEAYVRLCRREKCLHTVWKKGNVFELGSFCEVIIECKECGKRKLIIELEPGEVIE